MILPDVFNNRSVRLRMTSPAFTLFFGPRLTSDAEQGELLAYKSFLEQVFSFEGMKTADRYACYGISSCCTCMIRLLLVSRGPNTVHGRLLRYPHDCYALINC